MCSIYSDISRHNGQDWDLQIWCLNASFAVVQLHTPHACAPCYRLQPSFYIWHEIFITTAPDIKLFTSLPSGDSCFNKNLMSVCMLKQNSGGTLCGFTNIKSKLIMYRSNWKCSPVHQYRLNQSKWTFSTYISEGVCYVFPKVGEWVPQNEYMAPNSKYTGGECPPHTHTNGGECLPLKCRWVARPWNMLHVSSSDNQYIAPDSKYNGGECPPTPQQMQVSVPTPYKDRLSSKKLEWPVFVFILVDKPEINLWIWHHSKKHSIGESLTF